MECCLVINSEYIGKSEYSMTLSIDTHRNDVWRAHGPPCDKQIQNLEHQLNEHAKFTIIEKINNASLPRQQRRSLFGYLD